MRNNTKHKGTKISQRTQRFFISLTKKLCALCAFTLCSLCLSNCQTDEEIKRQKYITEGILLYRTHCTNCHQTDGKGLQALYPPIADSDYLAQKDSVIHLIRYGKQGRILVNGKPYNRPMPANKQLSDLEIAEIVTYIYHQWGNQQTITTADEVKKVFPAR
jgi:mono/diheme cytochrome c family protein